MDLGRSFSGIWGEGPFIFGELGSKQTSYVFAEAGSNDLKKNVLRVWGERSLFFQGAKTSSGRASNLKWHGVLLCLFRLFLPFRWPHGRIVRYNVINLF